MAEFIVAADAESAAIAQIEAGPATWFTGVTAGTKIPGEPKPAKFIRVLVTGGTERDMVTDKPTITVECYAVREKDAQDLAANARAVLTTAGVVGSMGGVPCYGVNVFARPQNLPNPQVPSHHRYQFTISADLRMAAAV